MPRRSKLDPLKDQILEWVRQGKDSRSIRDKLKELGVETTFQNVSAYTKRALQPIHDKLDKKAKEAYIVDVQKATFMLDGLIIEVMGINDEGMSLPQRNAFRSKLEALREKLKILGAYAPENMTQVAIINVNAKRELWKILGYDKT